MTDKTLLEYWFILYNRKVIILVIALSAMVTAGVLSKILSPVYEAKAVFFVPKEPDVTTFFTSPGEIMARSPLMPSSNEEPHGPYIGILKSQTIASLVQKDFPHKTAETLMRRDMDFVLSDEYMLEVYARDKNPRMAAAIANAYVKYFEQLMGEYSLVSQSERQATLEEDITRNQKGLSRAKGILKVFQQKNRTAN
jgi:capsular polysaccharide biosynthesis protein